MGSAWLYWASLVLSGCALTTAAKAEARHHTLMRSHEKPTPRLETVEEEALITSTGAVEVDAKGSTTKAGMRHHRLIRSQAMVHDEAVEVNALAGTTRAVEVDAKEATIADSAEVPEHHEAAARRVPLQSLETVPRRSITHPLSEPSLQHVSTSASSDLKAARVEFEYPKGRYIHYDMHPESLYTSDAEIHHDGLNGAMSLSVGSPRTFVARAAGRLIASARLHEDGTVSGLFEDQGHWVEVRPLKPLHAVEEIDQKLVGVHIVERISRQAAIRNHGNTSSLLKQSPDNQDGDDGDNDDVFEGRNPDEDLMGHVDQWWPGCFEGDSNLHTVTIGIVADAAVFESMGDRIQWGIESMLSKTNFVYERQFHVKLMIGYSKTYESPESYPRNWYMDNIVNCKHHNMRVIPTKLNSLIEGVKRGEWPQQAVMVHLTSCNQDPGTGGSFQIIGGMANLRGLCRNVEGRDDSDGVDDYTQIAPTAVVNFHCMDGDVCSSWNTFAHELGHSFGGHHTFELGMALSRGILSYGPADPNNDGVAQFSTKYRKAEMCYTMNRVVCNCRGKFVPASSQSMTSCPAGGYDHQKQFITNPSTMQCAGDAVPATQQIKQNGADWCKTDADLGACFGYPIWTGLGTKQRSFGPDPIEDAKEKLNYMGALCCGTCQEQRAELVAEGVTIPTFNGGDGGAVSTTNYYYTTSSIIDNGASDDCEDEATNCNAWANHCSFDYAQQNCKKTCGVCTNSDTRGASDNCEDTATNCNSWVNHCSFDYAQQNCKKTCGVCTKDAIEKIEKIKKIIDALRLKTHFDP